MEKQYSYEDFLEIIKTLRSENGCPWDREQTHKSLRPCMTEEAAEVNAAIRIYEETGSFANLREELGDVLLQVVMHARIAEEEGIFTMEDVVNEVAEKMVRRHPHVFGDVAVETSGQVLQNWEEIKKKEKEGTKEAARPLHEIPLEFPALTRATKMLKKADKFYKPGNTYEEDIQKLQEAVNILSQCEPKEYSKEVEEQIGNLLMTVCDLSRICKHTPEQILTDQIDTFMIGYEKE